MKQFEFNGFYYCSSKEKILDVVHNREIPSTFFKYYALNDNSVDALTNMYIYASHPAQLNDPFDCDIHLIEFDDDSVVKAFAKELYNALVFMYPNERERKDFCRKAYQEIIYTKCGIFSMTTRRDNINLWATYTEGKGVCVELDYTKFPFQCFGPYPINYSNELQTVKVSKCGIQRALAYQTNVKKMCWKQEEEWRLLISNPDGIGNFESMGEYADVVNSNLNVVRRIAKYPKDAVRSVTLAINFFDNEKSSRVTDSEIEIECDDIRKRKILDFLISTDIPAYLALKNKLGVMDFASVKIYKLHDSVYRLIEK